MTDLGTQSRYLTSPTKQAAYDRVRDYYASQMSADLWRWEDSPPIVFGPIFYMGREIYAPGDGHTRIEAARQVGFETILCEVRGGALIDALRYSIGPANRNFFTNKLDASDVTYRVYLALQDRTFWGWTDRRILDYCDDGNRLIKLRKVTTTRSQLLKQWQAEHPTEYQWRKLTLESPDTLLDIDSQGTEFPASHRSGIKKASTKVDPQDISRLAYTTAQFRAAQSGCSVEQWIESAIVLADRQAVPTQMAIGTTYTYQGDTAACQIYDDRGEVSELSITICQGYQVELLESAIGCEDWALPVRLVGCLWRTGFYLKVPIGKLIWNRTTDTSI